MITLDKIYQASHVLKEVIRETKLIEAKELVKNSSIYLKTENLQVTGSFKVRGAYYKISRLTEEEKARGIIACSAGNHAQGVALAAMKRGIKATIFIPSTAPISKVEATRKYGCEIRLVDGVYDDAYKEAVKYQEQTQGTFIHPFDDEDVIVGQGTIGLEILEQLRDVDNVLVPIGGGGLISGVAFAIKSLKPDCKVYGVQAKGADSMYESFKNKKIIELDSVSTFADGTAVKLVGNNTFDICSKYVDDIVLVSDDEIASAVLTLMEKEKLVSEGSGALSLAAAMFGKIDTVGKKTVCLLSGGNIDVSILSKVIHRALLKTGRRCEMTIEMLDKPGQLKEVSAIIADLGANVVRVRHNQGGENTAINGCFLKISMETKDFEHMIAVKSAIEKAGYRVTLGD